MVGLCMLKEQIMATRKSKPAAKKAAPAKKTVGRPRRSAATALLDDEDGVLDILDGEDDDEDDSGEAPDDGVSTGGHTSPGRQRAAAELAAALSSKKDGLPSFPFPPELPEAHKPYWVELVNSRPLGYFNKGDLTLLKMYCRAAYDSERLSHEIDKEGEVIRNAKGNPVVNPKVVVRSIAEQRVMSLAAKLRVQPSARYDSGNDKKQQEKVKHAEEAAATIQSDEDDLLAGKPPTGAALN